uniref:Beta-lactamase domain-containing protein n=1 Tax=Angiostrongylus cantonensis TaxID=6313 RepID=A0A0K0D1G5_ANGCA
LWNKCTANNPEQRAMEQAAAFGIGNAHSLGSIFNLLVTGQLVSEKMLSFLERPVVNETDYVINAQITKGHGFFYAPIERGKDSRLVHHSGHGCQQITFDIRKQVVIAYVTNALKMGHFDSCRNYWRIHKAVYDIVEKSSN